MDTLAPPSNGISRSRFCGRASFSALAALEVKEVPRLTVRSAGHVAYVPIPDIDWVEAADYYACLHVGTKSHLLRQSMAELERELDPRIFCRIHRSTIINLRRVRGLKVDDRGEYEVVLEGGQKLRLSRRFRKDLQARMSAFGMPLLADR